MKDTGSGTLSALVRYAHKTLRVLRLSGAVKNEPASGILRNLVLGVLLWLIVAVVCYKGISIPGFVRGFLFGTWITLTCGLITVLPGMQLLQVYREALQKTLLDLEALREGKGKLENVVAQRTTEPLETRDQAREAGHATGVFLADLNRHPRAPLGNILVSCSLLEDSAYISPEQQKDLGVIRASGEYLSRLDAELMDIATIETPNPAFEKVAFNPRELLRAVVESLQLRARKKNVQLRLEASSSWPRLARTDARKLRQVLVNLIGNAIEYTQQGGVIVRAYANPTDDHNRVLSVEVEDTGIRVAPYDQSRVLEPFVQAGAEADQQGAGLTLSISRRLIKLIGGQLYLETATGEGRRFRIELPVELTEDSELSNGWSTEPSLLRMAPGQPEFRILIVDDDEESRVLLHRLLQGAGFRVMVARNSRETVETFRRWQPHLMCVRMRMDLGLVPTIRSLDGGREVRIAAMIPSALATERGSGAAADADVDDFIPYPHPPDEIFQCLKRQLGVFYVHPEPAEGFTDDSAEAIRPERIAALPVELRQELSEALVSLDARRIAALIERVRERDAGLGAVLDHRAWKFSYTPILTALDAASSK